MKVAVIAQAYLASTKHSPRAISRLQLLEDGTTSTLNECCELQSVSAVFLCFAHVSSRLVMFVPKVAISENY